jgi:hypothetical protein
METLPPRRTLPIGIQNLREIREQGHYYVDKTGLAVDLIEAGKTHFLSRPRRFGKSLLVDTLKELFEGNRALFEGLAAEPRWDWSRRHPVIRISFCRRRGARGIELEQRIRDQLRLAREAGPGSQRRDRIDSAGQLRRTDPRGPPQQPASARWRCWWTNTTNPSWTTWATRPSLPRCATACAACTRCSRGRTRT